MIQILNERLREAERLKEDVTIQIMDINRHLLRMNKVEVKAEEGKTTKVSRITNPIQNKLRQAELASHKEAEEKGLIEERKKQYDERLDALTKEIEQEEKKVEVH